MRKLLAVAALTACSVFASTMTDPSIPAGSIAAPGSFEFAQFDPALGLLTGIVVNLSTTATGSIIIFNPTGGPLAFTSASATVPFTLTFTGGAGTFSFSETATTATGGIVPPGVTEFIPGVTSVGSSSLSIPSATAGYQGLGFTPVFNLSSAGAASINGNGDPSLLYGGSANGTVTATITYTYTSSSTTPEPATMTLFGTALLGIGFFARKRYTK